MSKICLMQILIQTKLLIVGMSCNFFSPDILPSTAGAMQEKRVLATLRII